MKKVRATKTAWILAGGTGGHIFPALAVAKSLQRENWNVRWVGAPGSMEARVTKANGLPMDAVQFSGVRGNGLSKWMKLPVTLYKAVKQSLQLLDAHRPNVVIGFGGYISFPAGLAAIWRKVPLVLHEQNSVAGMANKVLARKAATVFTAFPDVLDKAEFIGNPLREEFVKQKKPQERFDQHAGRLKLLVVGGSQGAAPLNKQVPKALARISEERRPEVVHQSGEQHLEKLRSYYEKAGVQATTLSFIDDMAGALALADVVVCRAGASTVTELAAVGVGAIFVPYPFAVDDHQTTNAKYLVSAGAGKLLPQDELKSDILAALLSNLDHNTCKKWAVAAHKQAKLDATAKIVAECERLQAQSNVQPRKDPSI